MYEQWYYQNPQMCHKEIVDSIGKLKRLARKLSKTEEWAYDTETNTLAVHGQNKNFKCVGISISWGFYHNYYIPLGHIREEDWDRQLPLKKVVKYLKPQFEREDIRLIGQNLKFDMHVASRIGIYIKTRDLYDVMIASWLCDENSPNGLKENSMQKLGVRQEHFAEVTNSVPKEVKKAYGLKANSKPTFDMVLIDDGAPYALADSFYTWCLYIGSLDELEKAGMDKIYAKTYSRFIRTLFEMEEWGVTVDTSHLQEMKEGVSEDKEKLIYRIYELAGCEFNTNSNEQLCELLFGYEKPVPTPQESTKWRTASEKERERLVRDYNKKIAEKEAHLTRKYSFNFKPISTTPSGAPQANAKALMKIAKQQFKVKRKMEGVELCKLLLQCKKLEKLSSAFLDGLEVQLYDDGKAHPSFNIIGTDSGRISCIAKHTMIKCMGEDKPIQSVKVGDYVYCYNENGELQLKRVLNVMNNGVRPCVKIEWVSQGTHDIGSLICTPDHKIFNRDLKWVRADSLTKNDSVVHLRRSICDNRPRLYGYNSLCVQEQIAIKNLYFNDYSSKNVIHHIDHNPLNNSIANLTVMGRKDHTRLHSLELVEQDKIKTAQLRVPHRVLKGAEHPMYINIGAEELESLVREYNGRIRDIPMDFDTFKKKCKEVGFDYKKVAGEYQTQYREVSDDEFINAFYECKGIQYAIHKKLNIGRTKVKNIIDRLDLCYNHKILSVKPCGSRAVYDLEVEDCHNFIANEICVHNCSAPNLQQLPKADEEDKYQIRSLFVGSEYVADKDGNWVTDDINSDYPADCVIKRKKIIAGDYNNLEMRVLAHFSKDANLLEMFETGSDTHSSTAVNMFELDCDVKDVKKKYPHLRQAAKVINFLLMYGGGAFTLYNNLKDDPWSPIDLGEKEYLERYGVKKGEDVAQIYIDKYFDTYHGVTDFMRKQKRFAHKNGYVQTLLRRKRRLPDINGHDFKMKSYCERLSVNSCIQGSAADITMSAQNRVNADNWFDSHGIHMVLQIHDELVFECPEKYVDECIDRAQKYMGHPFGDNVELNLPMLTSWDSGNSYQDAK